MAIVLTQCPYGNARVGPRYPIFPANVVSESTDVIGSGRYVLDPLHLESPVDQARGTKRNETEFMQ